MLRVLRQAAALAVVATFLLPSLGATGTPSEEEEDWSCVNVAVSTFGTGLGLYAIRFADAVGLSVESGVPEDGLRSTLIIVPSLCVSTDILDTTLAPVRDQAVAMGAAPILP